MKTLNLTLLALLGTFAYALGRVKVLDPSVTVEWTVTEDLSSLTFEATFETLGWVALGFSSHGGMAMSDIVIGGVFEDGTTYFDDYHGPDVGNGRPIQDETNNYKLISARENGTHTVLKFSRDAITCDDQDMDITEANLRLIWAYGTTDELSKHEETKRGGVSVYLLDPELPLPDLSHLKIEEISKKIQMPKQKTTYWCSMHKLPNFTNTRQMIAYEPVFKTEESKLYTHHMNILKCMLTGDLADQAYAELLDSPGTECYQESLVTETCLFLEYGWALGGELAINPDKVGFPFESNQYYKLEVHLNNPSGVEGVEVDVGFHIYYTEEPQEITGKLLMVSAPTNYQLMIPPNSTDFIATAHCMPQCLTFDDFPAEGVTAYNAFLHAHTSARGMRLRHYRDGFELPWLINDENYDFNYQTNRRFPQEVKILPGDQITLECIYDTHWKKGLSVIGGSSTDDEMCMAFIAYYPAIPNFVGCYDWMDKRNMFKILGVENVDLNGGKDPKVINPPHLAGKKFSTVVEEFDWTTEAREKYQWEHQYGEHITTCLPRISMVTGYYPHVEEYKPLDVCSAEPSLSTTTQQDNNSSASSLTKFYALLIIPILVLKLFYI